MSGVAGLDRDRIRELFDLRENAGVFSGGSYTGDPHPRWHELRESGPIQPGIVHELTGFEEFAAFHGLPEPDRPHFSAFSFAACDAAYRNEDVFRSAPEPVDAAGIGVMNSMLAMNGMRHRQYRALVQPSFVPAKAKWWIANWIQETVDTLIDGFVDAGQAELNVDFCASIPVLTITGSFGIPIDQALDVRAAVQDPGRVVEILTPIVAARREHPGDDLISVLVEAEIKDQDGQTHRLSDPEIYSFAILLLAAGSGTTWKQMGITLAALLTQPQVLDAVREDPALLKAAIEESVRWEPTDPMFSRWVVDDIDFFGTHIPKGSMLHLCLGAANRDPERWDRPDEYDVYRAVKPTLGFGGGPHVCLGSHVARAEMATGIGALLDRLCNLRLDPDAEPPRPTGFYERGVMEIPVVWDI
ncbi:MAG: cytochrome P450 [Acidimicrobiia bacterium]|nr:cytochrome P450 [Acidimicrobiia bacterium]